MAPFLASEREGTISRNDVVLRGTWKAAAKQLVRDMTVWVEANRTQLVR